MALVGRVGALVHLNRGRPAATSHRIQQPFGRLASDHRVGDLVGVALVDIPDLAHPALQADAGPLLDHVGGLMGGQVQRRRTCEGHVTPGRIRLGADGPGGRRRAPSDMSLHAPHIVASKRPLDRLGVGQGAAAASHSGRCGLLHPRPIGAPLGLQGRQRGRSVRVPVRGGLRPAGRVALLRGGVCADERGCLVLPVLETKGGHGGAPSVVALTMKTGGSAADLSEEWRGSARAESACETIGQFHCPTAL